MPCCSLPRTKRPTSPAPSSTSTAALWRGSSGKGHLGEGNDANARRLQALAGGGGDDDAARLVAMHAQRVEPHLQRLAVPGDDLLVQHHMDDAFLDHLGIMQDCARYLA